MRRFVLVLLGCTTLLLIGYTGIRGYTVWKQNHMMTLAHRFMAKSDARNALLCLGQVLHLNPRNVGACRAMAELSESSRPGSALAWRSRVVDLSPKSIDDRLALARTALLMRDLITATNALAGMTEDGKQTAAYHATSGLVAVALNEFGKAEAHFLQASRLEPASAAARLNLAVVRLRGIHAQAASDARITLNQLAVNPAVSCQALRELVADAVRHRQTNEALNFARQLARNTNSAFSDRLVRLALLRGTRNSEFPSYLATLAGEAAGEPAKIYELAAWQMMATGPANAVAWMETLPANVRTNRVIPLMMAQCRSTLRDWRGLLVAAQQQNWAELESSRHAFMAHAMRELDLSSSAKTEWEQALKGAGGRKQGLVTLLRLAIEWSWPNEQEQIFWSLVNQFPGEKWATAGLAHLLLNRGRTQALLTLFGRLARTNPDDLSAKNNLALTALLLDARQLKPHQLAREVYDKAPTNAAYASTYAYSLFRQDKLPQALKVIEQLHSQDLEKPAIASYYGFLLQACGNSSKARKYLDLAAKALLLPEERKLVEQARRGG